MVTLNVPEEEFKLLLTLCAHDFRHDFMNTSMRVHTGIFEGVKLIGGNKPKQTKKTKQTKKSKHSKKQSKKQSKGNSNMINKLLKYIKSLRNTNMTRLAIVINDHILLKNLNNLNVKNKKGLNKALSIKTAMVNTVKEFNLTISIINKLNNSIINENNKNIKNRNENINKLLVPELGAAKKKSKSTKRKKKKRKSRQTVKKYKIMGGSSMDQEIKELLEMREKQLADPRHELYFGLDIVEDDLKIEEDIEKIKAMSYPSEFITDELPEDEGILIDKIEDMFNSYEEMEDFYNNLDLGEYISSFEVNSTDKQTIDTSKELLSELNEVRKEKTTETIRRSGRNKKEQYYGENVDISVYEDWNGKYEIYSSLFDVNSINVVIGEEGLKIKPSNDFKDLREFSTYYSTIAEYFGKKRLNFNGFIQLLHNMDSSIPLAIAQKVSSSALKSIKEFGNKVSKVWYTFITNLAPRALSPAVSPPSKPMDAPTTLEGKLLGKMLRLTHDCKSTDATVFKLFTNYFKTVGINGNMKHPEWVKSSKKGKVINNASQLPKHTDIFGEIKEGVCWAPCVIDAMSNCPRLQPGYTKNIDISVGYSGTNYIDYHIHNTTETSCDMSFLITNNGKNIYNGPTTINYNYKTLSVVNVIKELMDRVNQHVSGLGGATLEEKVARFNTASAGQVLEKIVLPVVCMKLFGDLGQELLSIGTGFNFASNDRPSAARFLLLKKIYNNTDSGGGYFPNDKANRFYV